MSAFCAVQDPEDLHQHRILCTPGPEPLFKLLIQWGSDRREVRLKPHLRCEHFPFLYNAMRAHAGIALLPDYAVGEDLRAGLAVQVLPSWQAQGLGDALYVLTMPDRHPSHAVRVLIDYLYETLGEA